MGATWKQLSRLYMNWVYMYMNGVQAPFMYMYGLSLKTAISEQVNIYEATYSEGT